MQSLLPVSSLYLPFFGLMFVVITMRVGDYRRRNRLPFGDGGDARFQSLIRAQANFTESVPIGLLIFVLLELSGQTTNYLHGLFLALAVGRMIHYLQLVGALKSVLFRMFGMLLTLGSILVGSLSLFLRAIV